MKRAIALLFILAVSSFSGTAFAQVGALPPPAPPFMPVPPAPPPGAVPSSISPPASVFTPTPGSGILQGTGIAPPPPAAGARTGISTPGVVFGPVAPGLAGFVNVSPSVAMPRTQLGVSPGGVLQVEQRTPGAQRRF